MDARDQFAEKEAIRQGVRKTLDVLAGFRRGQTAPWVAIESAAGISRYSTHWAAFFKRLRRDFLRNTGICLWPVPTVGMRLLTVQEQLTTRAAARRRKAFRQMRKDECELAAVPDKDMTARQRLLRSNQMAAAKEGKREVLRQLRVAHILSKPSGGERVRPTAIR